MKKDKQDEFPEDWRAVRWGEPSKSMSVVSIILLAVSIIGFCVIAFKIGQELMHR
jgi:hypothetical protein